MKEVAATTGGGACRRAGRDRVVEGDNMVGTVGWWTAHRSSAASGCRGWRRRPRSRHWVGVKNELSVTWLTKVNCHLGVVGKLPAAALAVEAELLDELLHAAISAEAAAVALNSPAPSSSRRREARPSCSGSQSLRRLTGSIFSSSKDLHGIFPWTGYSRAKPAAARESVDSSRER